MTTVTEQQVNNAKYSLGIRPFIAIYYVIQCCRMSQAILVVASARTLERRFGLNSQTLGSLLVISDCVVLVLVLFVGYFGNRVHVPKTLSFATVLLTASSMCFAAPYFVYGPRKLHDSKAPLYVSNDTNLVLGKLDWHNHHLCQNEERGETFCKEPLEDEIASWSLLMWFILGELLNGAATSVVNVLGMTYIDANTPASKLGFYIGIANTVYAVAPIVAFPMAGIILKLPEAIFYSDLSNSDPRWIGCWWLGFIIVAFVQIICAVPMLCFPRSIITNGDNNKTTEDGNVSQRRIVLQEHEKVVCKSRAVRILLQHKPFIIMIIINIATIYTISYSANVPRYVEVHFKQPASVANFQAASSAAVSGIFGMMFSGSIISYKQMKLSSVTLMAAMAVSVTITGYLTNLFNSCPHSSIAGISPHNKFVPLLECSKNCSCVTDLRTFQPTCGSDDITYFSPCHAGCSVSQPNVSVQSQFCNTTADA